MAPQTAGWKRWLGSLIIGLFCTMMGYLVYAAVKIGMSIAAPGMSTRLRILTSVVVACLLVLPAGISWTLLRRKWKTGTFRLSPEEQAAVRARCAQPRSLKVRILPAVFNGAVAGLYTYSAFRPGHHSGEHMLLTVVWWVITGVWVYRIFRPPKCSIPPNNALSS
jgi:hypothetical protein